MHHRNSQTAGDEENDDHPFDKEQTQTIREWAKAAGRTVSSRGRIAKTVQDAFDAAHLALGLSLAVNARTELLAAVGSFSSNV